MVNTIFATIFLLVVVGVVTEFLKRRQGNKLNKIQAFNRASELSREKRKTMLLFEKIVPVNSNDSEDINRGLRLFNLYVRVTNVIYLLIYISFAAIFILPSIAPSI